MKQYSNKSYNEGFQWGPFILGVLSLLLAFFAFNNPVISIFSVAVMFAVGAILKGIFELFFRKKLRQFSGYSSTFLIVIGIIDILIGVFFLFNLSSAILTLPILFGLWVIFDSIGTLTTASPIREFSTAQYWLTIVIGIFGIVIGFLVIVNPLSAYIAITTLIGIYFMLYGILNIVYAF